jgi:hypothetical protein
MSMLVQQFMDCRHLLIHGQLDNPHNRTVRQALNEHQLAEILVLRDQYASFTKRIVQELGIACTGSIAIADSTS